MAQFSDVTLDLLESAGWSANRSVETTTYVEALQAEGYPICQAVTDFLSSFGGLKVIHPHAKVTSESDNFYIDPLRAVREVPSEKVTEYYSERAGTPLCVIGEASDGYLVLMMDCAGKVYAGYDELFWKVGHSGTDAVEAICRGYDFEEVPE